MTPTRTSRVLFGLLIVVEALGFTGLLPWTPTYSWLGLIVTSVAVWVFVEWFRVPDHLRPWFFAGLLLDAVADTFRLYQSIGDWDRLMHLTGGALVALAVWGIAMPVLTPTVPRRWRIAVVLAAVALVGTLYEGMELGVDLFYATVEGQTRGALGDGVDTVDDELLNLTGALVVIGIAEYRRIRSASPARQHDRRD